MFPVAENRAKTHHLRREDGSGNRWARLVKSISLRQTNDLIAWASASNALGPSRLPRASCLARLVARYLRLCSSLRATRARRCALCSLYIVSCGFTVYGPPIGCSNWEAELCESIIFPTASRSHKLRECRTGTQTRKAWWGRSAYFLAALSPRFAARPTANVYQKLQRSTKLTRVAGNGCRK